MHFELPIQDPVLTFALVMLLILVAPLLSMRVRLPGVVGVILAGALVGPSAANLLTRDGLVGLLGTVGLLYLMFTAGLSLEINQFIKHRNHSLIFGLMAFGLPQTLGTTAGIMLLDYDLPSAILLGSIIASHTLLAYPIAQRIGITRNPAITMGTGSSLVTDGAALLILAGVVGMQSGEAGAGFWFQFVTMVAVYVAIVLLVLPRLGRWFFRNVTSDPTLDYIFLLALMFATAWGAELVRLEPIIGAFLAGLTLNRLVPDNSTLMTRVSFVGDALFIPFFLLSVGMLVDFRVLVASLDVWYTAALFAAAALSGKTVAAKLAQRMFGYTPAEGWAVLGLTLPQAAATLAVTLVGFELGLFDTTTVNAVVMLILLTCVIGPWLLERYGRQVALTEETQPRSSDAPRRILVPLANPEAAEMMMDIAFMIRPKNAAEPLYPLTVALEGRDVEAKVAAGERMLGYAVIHAAAAEVPVIPVTRVDLNVAAGILRAQRELRISTVVIGWKGTHFGLGRIFGTVVDQVIQQSGQQILVCRFVGPINTTQRLMLAIPPFAEREVGFDESVATVKRLVQQLGVKLTITGKPGDLTRLEKRLARIKPDVPFTLTPAESAFDALSQQSPAFGKTDMLIQLSARAGRISWHPGLDRLPRQFVGRYPESNFVALYPSETAPEPGAGTAEAALSPAQLLSNERIVVGISESEPAAVVRALLSTHFSDRPQVMQRVMDALQVTGQSVPIEVTPGVALMHTHTAEVEQPTLFMGTLDEGRTFPRINNKVFVVFVLLSPRDLPPKQHLESLAAIAQLVHSPTVVKNLYSARSVEAIRSAMTNSG